MENCFLMPYFFFNRTPLRLGTSAPSTWTRADSTGRYDLEFAASVALGPAGIDKLGKIVLAWKTVRLLVLLLDNFETE